MAVPSPLFRRALLSTLVSSAALVGCKEESKGPGSLVVPYQLGNNKTCAETGVENVRVLLDAESDAGELGETDPCIAGGDVRVDDIPPGVYPVTVQGIDGNGVIVMDNLSSGSVMEEVFGNGAVTEMDRQVLADRPATLRLRWDVGFSSCEGLGIEEFEITAFEQGGTGVLLTAAIDCTEEGDAEGYRTIVDEDRKLNGNLFGEVGVNPMSGGALVGEPLQFTFDPVGPGYSVELTMNCAADGGCMGSGVPD